MYFPKCFSLVLALYFKPLAVLTVSSCRNRICLCLFLFALSKHVSKYTRIIVTQRNKDNGQQTRPSYTMSTLEALPVGFKGLNFVCPAGSTNTNM